MDDTMREILTAVTKILYKSLSSVSQNSQSVSTATFHKLYPKLKETSKIEL